ncbi:MAG TPA: hypothetical protein VGR15_06405, partial [Bacteroidota bacterium]|nr:hypothetical protein [Bacteroidota bacterium]
MNSTALRSTLVFSVALVILHIIGAVFPTIFTWGFHFLGFLPASFSIIYLLIMISGMVYIAKGYGEPVVTRLSLFMDRRPIPFLVIVSALFIVFAILLRVKLPLLGDSFLMVKRYGSAALGAQVLPASHQPLSQYFFYLFVKLLGSFNYPDMLDAFLVAELLLGIGFIVISYFTVVNIFEMATYRCLSFLLLLALPYTELFFGYVEMYAVILFVLALYILVGALYLRGKIHFAAVPIAFTLLVLAHYLNVLVFP